MNVSVPYDIITIMLRGHNVINIHYSKPDHLKSIFYLTNIISIVLLVFADCEDALRLSLLEGGGRGDRHGEYMYIQG